MNFESYFEPILILFIPFVPMMRKKKTKRTKVSVSPNIERRQKLVLNLLTSTPWPWFHTDTCTCLPLEKDLNRYIITHMGKHKAQSNFNDEVDIVAKPEGSHSAEMWNLKP